MTICIAACLFLLRTGSLSLNRDVGSATPTTGAAWPNILTHVNAKSSTTARIFFMGAILRQPKSWCQVICHSAGVALFSFGTPDQAAFEQLGYYRSRIR